MVTGVIARLPRLDGVEHDADCPDQSRPLRFLGSSQQWDGDVQLTVSRFACRSCDLDVQLQAERAELAAPAAAGR